MQILKIKTLRQMALFLFTILLSHGRHLKQSSRTLIMEIS